MDRKDWLGLLRNKLSNKNLVSHSIAMEAVMGALAEKFNEDKETWALSGLLHDLDYEVTASAPEKHGLVTEEWLKDYDLNPEVIEIIKAHNADGLGLEIKSKADRAIYAADPLTGLIVAAALMMPNKKIAELKASSVLKRFRTSAFARGANREHIASCEKIGLSLEEFISIALPAMQEIGPEIGL